MRKEVLAALSVIGVGSAIFFWASRHHSISSSTQGVGSTIEGKKSESMPLDGQVANEKTTHSGEASKPVETAGSNSQPVSEKNSSRPETASKPQVAVVEKTEPAKKVPTCFQAEYQVPETDIPQILDLGKDLQLNAKTVCVRVNGSPVAFQFKEKAKNQIIIGSLHEQKNDVKVSYCVGVSKCSDPCVVKQDRFLAALGGEDDLKATGKEEGALSAEEQDLEKELASFQALRLSKEQKVFSPKQVTASCQKDAS